jgi:ferredoxin
MTLAQGGSAHPAGKVEADTSLCIGSGQCGVIAPGLFGVGDEGTVIVKGDGSVAEAELAAVENAVALCPVEALRVSRTR